MRHGRQRLEWRGHNRRDAGSQEPGGSKGWILPSLQRSTDLWHPDSSPAILTLNFWPLELWEDSFLCFEARSVSKLLPLPQETDTREKTNPKTCFRKRRTGGLGEVSSSDPQGCSLWIQQGLSCQGNPVWNQRTSWPTATWNAIQTFILGTTRNKNAIMGQTPILWEWLGPPEGVPPILSYHWHILQVEMHTCAFILPTLPSASDLCTCARRHFLSGNTKIRQEKRKHLSIPNSFKSLLGTIFPTKPRGFWRLLVISSFDIWSPPPFLFACPESPGRAMADCPSSPYIQCVLSRFGHVWLFATP